MSFTTTFADFSVIRANSSFHIFRIILWTLNSQGRRNFSDIFKRLNVQHFWVPFLSICIFTFLIWQNFLNFENCKYFKGIGLLFQKKNFFCPISLKLVSNKRWRSVRSQKHASVNWLSVQHFWGPFLSICIFTFLFWKIFFNFENCKYFKP